LLVIELSRSKKKNSNIELMLNFIKNNLILLFEKKLKARGPKFKVKKNGSPFS
jgi:hypothetical protein